MIEVTTREQLDEYERYALSLYSNIPEELDMEILRVVRQQGEVRNELKAMRERTLILERYQNALRIALHNLQDARKDEM